MWSTDFYRLRILQHISCSPTIPWNLWKPAKAQGHVPNIAGTSGSGVCTIVIWLSVTRWRPMKATNSRGVSWRRPYYAADAGGKAKKSRQQFQIVDFQQPAFHCLERPRIVWHWGARRQELYGCTCFFSFQSCGRNLLRSTICFTSIAHAGFRLWWRAGGIPGRFWLAWIQLVHGECQAHDLEAQGWRAGSV